MPTGIEPNMILRLQSLSHDPGITGTFQPLDTELCPNHEAKRMNQWQTEVSQAKKDHLLEVLFKKEAFLTGEPLTTVCN